MTVSKGTFKGSILVKDGKIAEVGEKVMEPPGAKIIDASNQYVIPGIIDCHSHIAADGGINEGSVSVSSMVDIKDVHQSRGHRHLPRAGRRRDHGQHSARLRQRHRRQDPAAQDALGQGCPKSMIFEGATPGIKFALGENPKRAGNPTGQAINGQASRAAIPPPAWAWKT